jgi:hypothetical protein
MLWRLKDGRASCDIEVEMEAGISIFEDWIEL